MKTQAQIAKTENGWKCSDGQSHGYAATEEILNTGNLPVLIEAPTTRRPGHD